MPLTDHQLQFNSRQLERAWRVTFPLQERLEIALKRDKFTKAEKEQIWRWLDELRDERFELFERLGELMEEQEEETGRRKAQPSTARSKAKA